MMVNAKKKVYRVMLDHHLSLYRIGKLCLKNIKVTISRIVVAESNLR